MMDTLSQEQAAVAQIGENCHISAGSRYWSGVLEPAQALPTIIES